MKRYISLAVVASLALAILLWAQVGPPVTQLYGTNLHMVCDNCSGGGGGAVTQSGTWTIQPGNTANITPWLFNLGQIAGSTVVADPCQTNSRTSANISLTTSSEIITGTSGKNTYICYLQFALGSTADNIALVEGVTGGTCGTSTAGMAGGTTAATGWNLLANGSVTAGTIQNWAFKTATTGHDVCLLVSSAAQVSGVVQYVQQ